MKTSRHLTDEINRRECLQILGLGVFTGCIGNKDHTATSDSSFILDTTQPIHPDNTETPDVIECTESNMILPLQEYPELQIIGGNTTVSFSEEYIHLLIVCVAQQEWIAVWQICTHGNCDVEWDEALGLVRCPCHHSLFDWNGEVLQGPATRDLSSFTVCLDHTKQHLMISRASPS